MAGDVILARGAGNSVKEYQTVQVGGVGNANKIPALNAAGEFDPTMLPASPATPLEATENIGAGDLINVFSSGGAAKVRLADNTGAASSKKADGYAPAVILAAATGTVVLDSGLITGLAGLTPGAEYFLGTAGDPLATAPTGSGETVQSIGKALSATVLAFQAGVPVELV